MTLKKSIILLSVVSIVFIPSISFAATDSALLNQETMQQRKELKNTIQASRAATLEKIKDNREELKMHVQEMRENFKTKLLEIKDEKKKTIVERIDTRLSTTNTTLTTRWNEALQRLSTLVTKIKEKSSTLKTEGKNTTALDNALTKATTAITNAQTLVTAQSQKEYTPTIVSDATLKNTVGTTVSQFRLDIQSVFKAVNDARLAVIMAEKELRKLLPGKNEASGSASITPTTSSISITPITSTTAVTPTATP